MHLDKRLIARYRLINQQLLMSRCSTPEAVVATMGAMQAQDYANALWAIGMRTPGATLDDVEEAIASHQIVRTWPMRGTLHFVATADVRWMLELLASRNISGSAGRRRQLELDAATLQRSGELLRAALQGNQQRTRSALFELLEAHGISVAGQRGFHILGYHAQTGLLCLAVHEGKQPTFALLDEWAPDAKPLPREEALGTFALRYFTSHGPATVADLARWGGITLTDARLGLGIVAHELEHAEFGGDVFWMPPAPHALHDIALPTLLLPGFDEYVLGYRDRSAVLSPEHTARIIPGDNGMFLPALVVDGQVVGTWKRTIKPKSIKVSIHPFEERDEAENAAAQLAAERYAQFLGRPIH